MKNILILGAGGSPAVNFAKSVQLDKEKRYKLIGVDINSYHKYLTEKFFDGFEIILEENKLETINRLIEKHKIDAVHAQPDIEVRWLSDNRYKVKARTFLPPIETINTCQNKFFSQKAWAREELLKRHPVLVSTNDYFSNLTDLFGLPFWIRHIEGAGARGAMKIEDGYQFKHWLNFWFYKKAWGNRGNPVFVAQEYFPGRDLAFQSLWYQGQMISGQGRERLEYIYPHLSPSGLTGTPLAAKICNDQKLTDTAINAITTINPRPHGIYCVDLKEDKNKIIRPTEINAGRFFTTSIFPAKLGKNMPLAFLDLMFDKRPSYLAPTISDKYHFFRHIDCDEVLCEL